MRRHGNLWAGLTSFDNLHRAARKAARHKRRWPNIARFLFNLEPNLLRLQRELLDGSYCLGPYRESHIYEPKPRLISAAPFRDRVVHHALCNIIEPIFERGFIHDSYACRKGKGTHAALDRFTAFARRNRYVLMCDVSRFFPSIDHGILQARIERKIKDPQVLWLIRLIIAHSNEQEPVYELYPGDDLLTPLDHRHGLPLGNQTSQFFSNVLLDPLDHYVKEALGVRGYCRYCDDFVLFGDDKSALAEAREHCRAFLAKLRLRLHRRKSVIYRTADGPRFLGFHVFPTHRRLARDNVARARRRLRALQRGVATGELTHAEVRQRLQSWIGHARHGNTWRLRQRLLDEVVFGRAL